MDALVELSFLELSETGGEAVRMKEALKEASISQLWDVMSEKIDGSKVTVGKFPRFDEMTIEFEEPADDFNARRGACSSFGQGG